MIISIVWTATGIRVASLDIFGEVLERRQRQTRKMDGRQNDSLHHTSPFPRPRHSCDTFIKARRRTRQEAAKGRIMLLIRTRPAEQRPAAALPTPPPPSPQRLPAAILAAGGTPAWQPSTLRPGAAKGRIMLWMPHRSRSAHRKGATGRVRTGDQQLAVLAPSGRSNLEVGAP